MYKSTLAFLMPSIILSKAASTAVDGPTAVRPPVAGDGDGEAAGLLEVFGVGVGLGSTVRPRLEVEVLVFWAQTARAQTNRIAPATKDLFMKVLLDERLVEFIPGTLAAQAQGRAVTPDYLKHLKHGWPDGLAGEHCARSIDEKASLYCGLFGESAERAFGSRGGERLDHFDSFGELRQQFPEPRLFQNVLAHGGFLEVEVLGKAGAALR